MCVLCKAKMIFCFVKGPEKVSIQSIVRQSGHDKRMKNVHPTFFGDNEMIYYAQSNSH